MAASDLSLLASLAHMLGQGMDSRVSADSSGGSNASSSKVTYCSATCLDQQCKNKLYFPQHEASVVCPDCGQRHSVADLTDRTVLAEEDQRFGVEASRLRKKHFGSKKTAEQIKVNGVSNFQCKLLSPLLSTYGMDNKDDHPYRLKERGMGDTFDCSKLSNRSFSIEEHYLQVLGYGLDTSGSQAYLKDILAQLREVNGGQDSLVPLHADGDGHCLVHAISRCLVGRELFWHALRSNLHSHLSTNLERYREQFKNFYSQEEWEGLIAEAAPDWKPPDGQSLGLSNIHIYGLANVLRRPIILLDSLKGMRSSGDYSAVFLPSMFTPEECSYKRDGRLTLNPPLVIAWSSSGRNHFIPLIPIKGRSLPKLPPSLLPKVWGVDENLLQKYVSVCEDGSVEVYGGKELAKPYLLRLIKCMDQLFLDQHKVSPSLVGDVDLYVFKAAGCVGVATDTTVSTTYQAVVEERLYRCLICSAISIIPMEWLKPHGLLYEKAAREDKLQDGNRLTFPFDNITATYEAKDDVLVPVDVNCFCCSFLARRVRGNGTIIYENGDRTQNPAVKSRCGCGYKHYWDGHEYDNLPEKIPLSLNWNGKIQPVEVHWFQYESDPERNSNVFQVANKVVNDKFPGEFGSERLVQQVVDQILKATASSTPMEQVTGFHPSKMETTPTTNTHHDMPVTKTIMTGAKSRTLHKEELNMSEAEKNVRRRVQDNARLAQSQSKKRTKYSPNSQDAPHRKTTPPPQKTTPPKTTAPPKTQVSSSQKRVRVTTSDGRTCNLSLDKNVTYAQLLDAIERELSIPASQQKLRSGFPPRELAPPTDSSLPVDLANGEKVSVDILPPAKPQPDASMEVGVAASGKEASRAEEELLETADTLNTLLQQLLGKEVDLWAVAQHQLQHFHKGGDFYQQVMRQYGDQIQDNAHIQFKELPRKTFVFNADKECLELCLGSKHIPVRPLTAEEELAVAKAASEEGVPTTPTSTSVSSGGGVIRSAASQHVKAFSGKGHTLSSPTSSMQARPAATSTSSTSRPAQEVAAPSNLARYVQLPRREQAVSTEGSGMSQGLVSGDPHKDLAQRLGQNQQSTLAGHSSGESRRTLLQDQELSLQNMVLTLKNKLMEIGVNPGTDSQQMLLGLVDQLQKAQTNLDKVRGELAELSSSS